MTFHDQPIDEFLSALKPALVRERIKEDGGVCADNDKDALRRMAKEILGEEYNEFITPTDVLVRLSAKTRKKQDEAR